MTVPAGSGALTVPAGSGGATAPAGSAPNLLIVMSDQEQADLSDPAHPCRTPHAEALAAQGVRFTRAYCPTSHCCPSRASFFTGLYPSRHGVFNNVCTPTAINRGLRPGVVAFSERLREIGYRLGFAGKWHVSGREDPGDRGWEELLVRARATDVMHPSVDSWRQGRGAPPSGPRAPGHLRRPGWGDFRLYGPRPAGAGAHPDEAVVDAATTAMRRYARDRRPWCLFVGLDGPHDPYLVPGPHLAGYHPDQVPLPASYHDDLSDKPGIYRRLRRQLWSQLSEPEVRDAVRHYWAYTTMVDGMLGQLLRTLDDTGAAEDTVVVRVADHGDYAGAHGLFLKGVPAFREAYHIPAVVRWPSGIDTPGRTVDAPVTLADFAPTFLELAGVPPAAGELTGRSLVPFLRGEPPPGWPDEVHTQFNGVELYYTQRSVTAGGLKYVYNGFDDDELYDLRIDPHELVNRSGDPDYRAVERDLVARMWRFAAHERDELIFNDYGSVALAPWGPGSALA